MESVKSPRGQFIGLPFYVFVSVILGLLAVFGTVDIAKSASLIAAIGFALLFCIHIGFYWVTIKLSNTGKSFVPYYIIQAVLIAALVMFPSNETLKGSVLATTVISIIGQAIGFWGNTRKSLLLGLSYAALALALLYFLKPDNYWNSAVNLLVNGGFIVLFLVILNQQLTERQKAVDLAESLESANAKLAASAAKIETLTLQNERQRMARELHDTLSQGVAGHVLQLEAIKAHLAANRTGRAAAVVETAIVRARTTLAESRAAIDDLRAMPTDVKDAVHQKVERFKQSAGIPCELELAVSENQLPLETTNHALNILSESLTNILRHAQATQVYVKFFIQKETLELEVRDNGKGFDVNQSVSGHYGLVGMHERARLTGGVIAIESNSNGTNVQFAVGRP